ncbi:MAG TPA: hypothetical protein VL547_05580 [Dinghuibacter sp.]|uniref:hypothetical protein n=1 Tax=Dinghuibacter sp. TaxID=2024697 RepID=UPI002C97A094|nr:hypothetical protein [Dinghuibacter sp.]HTJ11470.1 hypothetical protein [Dinghuibacter sp.]
MRPLTKEEMKSVKGGVVTTTCWCVINGNLVNGGLALCSDAGTNCNDVCTERCNLMRSTIQ